METQHTELTEIEKKILANFEDLQLIEIDCGDFKGFYKPMSVKEDINWAKEYLIDDGSGNIEVSRQELLKCKFHYNLKLELPKKIIGLILKKEVEWNQLSKEEKYNLITEKLKPIVARKIIAAIREIDEGSSQKKN